MLMPRLALTLLVAAPLSIAAVQSFAAEKLSAQDETFMREAAQGGLAEVQDAQLAQQKAASAEVKQFAGRMITDHTKANNDLQQIAQSKSITPPPSRAARNAASMTSSRSSRAVNSTVSTCRVRFPTMKRT